MSEVIIIVAVMAVLVLIFAVLWWLDKKLHIGFIWRGFFMRIRSRREGPFPYKELIIDPLPMAACVDFGAFRKPLQNLHGIQTVVLMFDRTTNDFVLDYNSYDPEKVVPLDWHGPLKFYRTEADLRKLVEELHKQEIKVLIGFWAFWGESIHRPGPWVSNHPELKPRRWNEADFSNLFVTLKPEGITLTTYICEQHRKLWHDFGFDGLFLGDGFCGLRNFLEPWRYCDQRHLIGQFAEFYRIIAEAVHKTDGQLWAYDCMGSGYEETKLHGVDYKLLAEAGLDVLVFQSYPTAWGKYFRISGKTDLYKEMLNSSSVKRGLSRTNTRFYYSLELGDSVEGWRPTWKATRSQMQLFQKKADGKLLVWGNDVISRL